uniref:Uncharacterized protein n=1 Tax=Anguilla anguilla TaxID=7936 RepID=A0A0E9QDV7_ANGAN
MTARVTKHCGKIHTPGRIGERGSNSPKPYLVFFRLHQQLGCRYSGLIWWNATLQGRKCNNVHTI